jgi:hypothetical protein
VSGATKPSGSLRNEVTKWGHRAWRATSRQISLRSGVLGARGNWLRFDLALSWAPSHSEVLGMTAGPSVGFGVCEKG